MIYIYDKVPDDLEINGLALNDWKDLPEINRVLNGQYRFYGNYDVQGTNCNLIKKGNFIKSQVDDGTQQYFEIFDVKKNLNSLSVTARHIGFTANKNFIEMSFSDNASGREIMMNLQNNLAFSQRHVFDSNVSTVHQFTAKQVNPIDAIIGSNNGNQNLTGVTSSELDMDNYTLNLVKQIGRDTNYRIEFGYNLEAIEEEIDEQSVVNSLFLVGGIPDNDYDDKKDPITFKYLETDGVTDSNRKIGKYENSECKTVEDLTKWGQTKFDKDRVHEPKITHTISMISLEHTLEYIGLWGKIAQLRFGDTAIVSVPALDIEIKERMVEYTYFPTLNKYKTVVLGNDLSLYTTQVNTQATELKREIDNRTETMVTNVLNATAWITGNSGGHVIFRPEKAPQEILIMDTAEVDTAKRVWQWNLKGLGYSDNGVNGPFGIAITSKGEIVADFIKVGVINAEVFQTSFSKVGDQLKMVQGAIEAWNNGRKIMTLNKKGLEFWNTKNESIGTIGTTDSVSNPFPDAQTPQPLEDTSLVIRTQGSTRNILISPNPGKGLILLGNGTTISLGDLNIQGSLRVNGIEISGSGGGSEGGGGWSGDYPSIVTNQAQKFAWQAWTTLRALGYSEAASAGILGNINGEAGPSMNPDTDQIGGPAYGAVQFDGSAYPLVGAPTYNGREYFQRLHNASQADGDYRDMVVQMKVVNWTMKNGQWIGVINPTTVEGYKAMTDARTAATVFERNFERPATTHPIRSNYAQNWYDLFHGVQITKKDWVNPMHDASYNVTQEWDQIGWGTGTIHGGIDLAPTGGRSPRIYAARSGTVETVSYSDINGNYVIIRHNDNYWTYYGHLSSTSVSVGQQVTTDNSVGICGMTGLATGIHLHFEVWKNKQWNRTNPRDVIKF